MPTRWALQENYATVTVATSRTRHIVTDRCANIRLVYSGFKSMTVFAVPSELGMGNAWECRASIHIISSGVTEAGVIPVRFRGRRLALVPNGGFLVSDPVSIELAAGTEFFVYTFANRLISTAYTDANGETGLMVATGAYWPRDSATRADTSVALASGVGSQFSTSTGIDPFTFDKTDGAYSGLTIGNPLTCGPVAILGDRMEFTGQPPVAFVGDSILAGAGDRSRADIPISGRGYSDGLLASQCPSFNASLGGDGIQYKVGVYAYNFASRWEYVEACEVLYLALGTNDLVAGASLASTKANLQQFASQAKARGMRKVIVGTVLPRTTSTDGWVTLAGQTAVTTQDFTAQRALLNEWLLTVPSPFDAVVDLRPAVEDVATGKWKEPTGGTDLTTTTGSTTTVINLNSTVVASAFTGMQLIIGSETRQIASNTTNSITVVSAFTGAPGNGVAIKVRDTYTVDGVHPSAWGHKALGDLLNANATLFQ